MARDEAGLRILTDYFARSPTSVAEQLWRSSTTPGTTAITIVSPSINARWCHDDRDTSAGSISPTGQAPHRSRESPGSLQRSRIPPRAFQIIGSPPAGESRSISRRAGSWGAPDWGRGDPLARWISGWRASDHAAGLRTALGPARNRRPPRLGPGASSSRAGPFRASDVTFLSAWPAAADDL